MTKDEAIQILKPFRDCMVDQHGCPISDVVYALDMAIKALEVDTPTKPTDTPTKSFDTPTDLISRQAAIDALNGLAREQNRLILECSIYRGALHDVADAIKELPSAQPERQTKIVIRAEEM